MKTRYSIFVLAMAATPLLAQSVPSPDPVTTINAPEYQEWVERLAHDSLDGRDTPSEGLDQVAAWIASEFEKFGLEPGGDNGTFIQRFSIRREQFDVVDSKLRFGGRARAQLVMGRDFVVMMPNPFTDPRLGTIDGEMVFVARSEKDTAQAALADLDVDGKIIVQYAPKAERNIRPLYHPSWKRKGVQAVIWVVNINDDLFGNQVAIFNNPRLAVGLEGEGIPLLLVREKSVRKTLEEAGIDLRAMQKRSEDGIVVEPIEGVRASGILARRIRARRFAPNVVGIVPGSDPELADEFVIFSAHMDHVSRASTCRPEERRDLICNGADDDASGTAGVMQLARAFSTMATAPRRSMIFLLVSGEEKGLWGSRYFTQRASIDMDQVIADLNIDMIGRNWTDTIAVIGKDHSDLGETLDRVAEAHPELNMAPVGDMWPEENFYTRSDHYSFARVGIPILFFTNGLHEDYHKTSDEADKIDSEKASRLLKLIFYLGMEVADADARPQWDPESREEIVETS